MKKNIWFLRPDSPELFYMATKLSEKFNINLIISNTMWGKKFMNKKKFKDRVMINEKISNLSYYKDLGINEIPEKNSDYKNLYIAMQIMERNERFESELSFEERNYVLHKHYAFWKSKIEKDKPSFVIFPNIPHMYYEMVIISILNEKKIPAIIMFANFGYTIFLDKDFKAVDIGNGKKFDQLKNPYLDKINKSKSIKHDVLLNEKSLLIKDIFFLFKQILQIPIRFIFSKKRVDFNSKYIKKTNFVFGENSAFNENIANVKNAINTFFVRQFYNYTSKKYTDLTKKKYIYFPLISHYECHYHPANSPLNYIIILENLLSKIPKNVHVLVKEHPRQFFFRPQQKFSRNIDFYRKLKNFKNVEYISTNTNHRELIKNSLYVLCSSVSTTALECIALKKKFINFGISIFEEKHTIHLKNLIKIDYDNKISYKKEKQSKNLFFPERIDYDISKKTEYMSKSDIKSITKRLITLIYKY